MQKSALEIYHEKSSLMVKTHCERKWAFKATFTIIVILTRLKTEESVCAIRNLNVVSLPGSFPPLEDGNLLHVFQEEKRRSGHLSEVQKHRSDLIW